MFRLFHDEDYRFEHFLALGVKKTGKSTLLANMILNDVERGDGVIAFDNQGSLAKRVIEHIKADRNDIYYLDCTHHIYPMGWNIFELHSHTEKLRTKEKELIKIYFSQLIDSLIDEKFDEELEGHIRLLAEMAVEHSLTTLDALKILIGDETPLESVSQDFRDKWQESISIIREKYSEVLSDLQNKINSMLDNQLLTKITKEQKSTFDLKKVMDNGQVLIFNVPEEELGSDQTKLFIDLVLIKLKISSDLRKEFAKEVVPSYLYFNELPAYPSDLKTNILSEWLSEGRNLKLSLNMTQRSRGIFHKYSALTENCRVMALFQLEEEDADFVAQKYFDNSSHITRDTFTSLELGQSVLYTLNDSGDRIVLEARTTPMPQMKELHNYQAILERSINARSKTLRELLN